MLESGVSTVYLSITALILLAIAEIYMAPVIYSVLTLYSNPKYLAIMMSLVSLPSKFLFIMVTNISSFVLTEFTLDLNNYDLILAFILMIPSTIGLIFYLTVQKKPVKRIEDPI